MTLNPTVSRGLRMLGATADDPERNGAPRSEFRKLGLSASYFYPLAPSLYYLTSAYGQTSADNLYAGERISIGGQYSVRGFKEQYLTGNRGAYWRNELNWQWWTLPGLGAFFDRRVRRRLVAGARRADRRRQRRWCGAGRHAKRPLVQSGDHRR